MVEGTSGTLLVISASGSLDLEELNGVNRPNWFHNRPAKTMVFHWQDPNAHLDPESSNCIINFKFRLSFLELTITIDNFL